MSIDSTVIDFAPGTIVVDDRGYNDYRLFANWTDTGVFFVTRMKSNALYEVVQTHTLPPNMNILSDETIRFTGPGAAGKCPHPLRRIEMLREDTATSQAHMDVTPWVTWFVHCLEPACTASVAHVQDAVNKTRFWHAVEENLPGVNHSQRKVLNKLYDSQPDGFSNGLSTELYARIGKVSRATAYRELSALTAAGLLRRTGEGRGTRYVLIG